MDTFGMPPTVAANDSLFDCRTLRGFLVAIPSHETISRAEPLAQASGFVCDETITALPTRSESSRETPRLQPVCLYLDGLFGHHPAGVAPLLSRRQRSPTGTPRTGTFA